MKMYEVDLVLTGMLWLVINRLLTELLWKSACSRWWKKRCL